MLIIGMPGAEKRSDEKFGRNSEYLDYKASTSPLIPMPKALYRVIPMAIKQNLLFEFRLYSKYLKRDHDSDGPVASQ